MAIIIDGKELSKKVLMELKDETAKLKEKDIIPCLAVILVGNDPASKIYIRNKTLACQEIGVDMQEYFLPEDACECELLDLIDSLNNNENVDGILLQSPIPSHLNIAKAFGKISPIKDVDGFNPINARYVITKLSCVYTLYTTWGNENV